MATRLRKKEYPFPRTMRALQELSDQNNSTDDVVREDTESRKVPNLWFIPTRWNRYLASLTAIQF